MTILSKLLYFRSSKLVCGLLLLMVLQIYIGWKLLSYNDHDRKVKDGILEKHRQHLPADTHKQEKHIFFDIYSDKNCSQASSEVWNPDEQRKKSVDQIFSNLLLECPDMNKDAKSAYKRAKSPDCKEAIKKVSCLLDYKKLYPSELPRYCPLKGSGHFTYAGCYADDTKSRDLSGPKHVSDENDPLYCTNLCLASGYEYAGIQFGKECFCGDSYGKYGSVEEKLCHQYPCPSDQSQSCGGHTVQMVYKTGSGKRPSGVTNTYKVPKVLDVETSSMVRILFMLTWNGRAFRQVKRLFKQIYHVNHYYYIHVDARQEYMYREVNKLAARFDNVRVVHRRFATIWGGSTLLQMLLHTMKEAVNMHDWHWDFYMNLSESDYPVKSIEELTAFLSANRDKNFLKSHGIDTPKFLRKQGLLKMFYECDHHLWRVGNRSTPTGIRIDGGSDWICLNREFVNYVTSSQDELVSGLTDYFKYALLPAESYFHTVLQNSIYCESFVDNNLHKTNWNRKRGCLCQYKHIVDWCGCSPLDFTTHQVYKDKILKAKDVDTFFARKFEAVVSNEIVNWLDELAHGKPPAEISAMSKYWENVFHTEDSWNPSEDSQYTYYMSLARSTAKKLDRVQQVQECKVVAKEIRQMNLLKDSDEFEGLLVQVGGALNDGSPVEWEAFVKPESKFQLIKPIGPISRLQNIEVGSTFDLKERIYRDYGKMIGAKPKNLTVVQHWGGGLALDITLLVIDPLGFVAYASDVHVPQGNENYIITKVEIPLPLIPGVWKVKIAYEDSLVALTNFLVVPDTYKRRKFSEPKFYDLEAYTKNMEENHAMQQLYGKYIESQDRYFTSYKDLEKNLSGDEESLLQWVDNMVSSFWIPTGACAINYESTCEAIKPCNSTNWSSFSPDRKSDIGAVDPTTGKLFLY